MPGLDWSEPAGGSSPPVAGEGLASSSPHLGHAAAEQNDHAHAQGGVRVGSDRGSDGGYEIDHETGSIIYGSDDDVSDLDTSDFDSDELDDDDDVEFDQDGEVLIPHRARRGSDDLAASLGSAHDFFQWAASGSSASAHADGSGVAREDADGSGAYAPWGPSSAFGAGPGELFHNSNGAVHRDGAQGGSHHTTPSPPLYGPASMPSLLPSQYNTQAQSELSSARATRLHSASLSSLSGETNTSAHPRALYHDNAGDANNSYTFPTPGVGRGRGLARTISSSSGGSSGSVGHRENSNSFAAAHMRRNSFSTYAAGQQQQQSRHGQV